jgi:hypothetical protein
MTYGTASTYGTALIGAGVFAVRPLGSPLSGGTALSGSRPHGAKLRAMRVVQAASALREQQQRIQDVQGWTAFEQLEGTEPSAPATAHMEAISTKDGSGPYPWRQPV